MKNNHFTQVPNNVFDILLPKFTMAELKILLIIIRQTNGWLDETKRRRKTRDRISHSQFIQKSGLSRRIVIAAVQKLIDKKLIEVTNEIGTLLHLPNERKGKLRLYYGLHLKREKANTNYKKVEMMSHKVPQGERRMVTLKQLLQQKKQSFSRIRDVK